MNVTIEQVDALLPQIQCRKCGFAGCRPYAEAMVRGDTDINRCPPGGVDTIERLAKLFGLAPKCPDPTLPEFVPGSAAVIDERTCIGCLKCVRACPVDAIIGAAGQLHAVVPDWCNGCGLCLPPCPVDCIELRTDAGGRGLPAAPERYRARNERMGRDSELGTRDSGSDQKQAYIREAVKRVRERRRRQDGC